MPVLTEALRKIHQRGVDHLSFESETLWEEAAAEQIADALAIAPRSLYEEFLDLPPLLEGNPALQESPAQQWSAEQAIPERATSEQPPADQPSVSPNEVTLATVSESQQACAKDEVQAKSLNTDELATPSILPMRPARGRIALLCGLDTGLRSVGQAAHRLAVSANCSESSRLLLTLHSAPGNEQSVRSAALCGGSSTEPRLMPTPVPNLWRGSYLHGNQKADRRRLLVLLDRCRADHQQTYLLCNADLFNEAGASLVDFLATRCDDVYLTAKTTSGDVSTEAIRQIEVRLGRLGRQPTACLFTDQAA